MKRIEIHLQGLYFPGPNIGKINLQCNKIFETITPEKPGTSNNLTKVNNVPKKI